MPENEKTWPHYFRRVPAGVTHIDIYRVLEMWPCSPPLQHAVKKLLCAGARGSKDRLKDLREAKDSISRAIEMIEEEESATKDTEPAPPPDVTWTVDNELPDVSWAWTLGQDIQIPTITTSDTIYFGGGNGTVLLGVSRVFERSLTKIVDKTANTLYADLVRWLDKEKCHMVSVTMGPEAKAHMDGLGYIKSGCLLGALIRVVADDPLFGIEAVARPK
jgi:hypothetical protein